MSQPPETRADHGMVVHESLAILYEEAIKGKSLADVQRIKAIFTEARASNIEATAIRVGVPAVLNTVTRSDKISVLTFATRRARSFLINELKTSDFQMLVHKPNKVIRNTVDLKIYNHQSDVITADRRYVFATDNEGNFILSPENYWEEVVNA